MTLETYFKIFASRYGRKFKSEESVATEFRVSIYVSTGNDERNLTMCTGLKLIQNDKSYIRRKNRTFKNMSLGVILMTKDNDIYEL